MRLILICLISLLVCEGYSQDIKYTFVFLNTREDKPNLPKEELDKLMQTHLANIQRLANEGKLLVAGRFEDGDGVFIFRGNSSDSVKQWLSTDPSIQANRWRLEIFPYLPRVGSVCLVDSNVEMVTYTLIRYISTITKFNVQKAGQTFKKHDDYLKQIVKTGNVVTEGFFPNRDGGILVMKGEVDSAVIEADPSMPDTVFTIEIKKLWVGKGSFCEKD
ncbi:MAG: hypothetical protein KF860_09360 [Cyclobacteriaceae bacterium]|nr:hypothetical protein [Cyclobacteriaceae bacterium]